MLLQAISKTKLNYRKSSIFQNKLNFFITTSVNNSTESTEQSEQILKNVISSHIAYKKSLLQLLDTYHYFRNVEQDSQLRKMRELHNQHLLQLDQLVILHRVPPPLTPLTRLSFTLFGSLTSLLETKSCDLFAAQLCRIVENHTDYCLFQMNQHSVNQPDIRKQIIQMRDNSYNLSENVLSTAPQDNSCVSNISDYVFQPILRHHFDVVE